MTHRHTLKNSRYESNHPMSYKMLQQINFCSMADLNIDLTII